MHKTKGFVALLACGMIFGMFAIFSLYRIYRRIPHNRSKILALVLVGVGLLFFAIPSLSTRNINIGFIFGLLLMCISYLTLIGFQNFDLNLGTIVLSSELFFGPVFALIVFREYPTLLEFTGGLFIIAAIIASNLKIKMLQ